MDSLIFSQTIFDPGFSDFENSALELFHFQIENSELYRGFVKHLNLDPSRISTVGQIPFLPISFFKTHKIYSYSKEPELFFQSSSTTGSGVSNHYVAYAEIYKKSFRTAFRYFYRSPEDYRVLALLPSYLERENSSLIYMVQDLINESKDPFSGFFLHDHEALIQNIKEGISQNKKIILFGITYALLDLAEKFSIDSDLLRIIETGGMKGRRKEMVREELHAEIRRSFPSSEIDSEYGMTELLSQAYSKNSGNFYAPPWMKIFIHELHDPFSKSRFGKTGAINIIDLANIYSCAFIASQDLGRLYPDGSFEVLGRFDNSDLRGCNLMIG